MPLAQYPDYLPPPLQTGYSRTQFDGLRQVEAFAGPPITEQVTLDRPATYRLTWSLDTGQALVFKAWIHTAIEGGLKPFEITLLNESGLQKQEVKFVAGSLPQLDSVNADEQTYSAVAICRKINDPYEQDYATIIELAEISPQGNVIEGMRLLDLAINEDWPEA